MVILKFSMEILRRKKEGGSEEDEGEPPTSILGVFVSTVS
jgi:hypothetical protein